MNESNNNQDNNIMPNNQPLHNNQNLNNNSYQKIQQSQNNLKPNIPKKTKLNLGLIIGVIIGIITIGIIIFVINNSNSNDNNKSTNNSTKKEDIVYYDNTRELKDSYIFEEAVSEFAFLVGNSTLIFKETEKTKLASVELVKTKYGELSPININYKQDIYTSLGDVYVGESNSSSLEEFETKLKKGILSDKITLNVESVKIIESNSDYVFASLTDKGAITSYKHYFAKKIGEKIYYIYHTSITELNDIKTNLLLNEFKEVFNCLSKDDKQTPYIQDKIMNVPVVLNKQIKDVNSIFSIVKSTNDYHDGFVMFTLDHIDNINLSYGANKRYKKIDWTKDLTSSIKYSNEDDKNIFGVVDNDLTQIFEINTIEEINTEKQFNNYINKFFDNK